MKKSKFVLTFPDELFFRKEEQTIVASVQVNVTRQTDC